MSLPSSKSSRLPTALGLEIRSFPTASSDPAYLSVFVLSHTIPGSQHDAALVSCVSRTLHTLAFATKGLCICLSSAWNTLSHTPSIHSHLVNSISSKHHFLKEACPDCHSWSTPPLVPFAATATYLLVHSFKRLFHPHLLLKLNGPCQEGRNHDYLVHCYFSGSWNHGHPKYMLNDWTNE